MDADQTISPQDAEINKKADKTVLRILAVVSID